MSTTTTIPVYALDPTGTLAANKITNEPQILTPTNWRNYQFIVPKFAPYFMDSLKLVYRGTDGIVKILTHGIDWYEGHQYIGASRACAKPIYGSIVFMNNQLEGTVTIEYQTLGGEYCIDEARTMEILANALYNPRTSTWDAVSGIPNVFPVINHEWDLADMVGMSELVASMQRIEAEMRQAGQSGLTDHIANKDNPHDVDKEQIGLGLVANYAPATRAEAEAGIANNLYLTPQTGAFMAQALVGVELDAHKAEQNPHGTTAHDVGTYTSAELDTLLLGKLSVGAVAFDSNRFGGLLPADYAAEVLTGTAYNSERIAGRTYLELVSDAQGGAAANALQLEGLDLAAVKAYVLESGTAYDAARFGGVSYMDFWAAISAATVDNAVRFGGKTYVQFMNDLNSGTVSNALKLNGKDEATLTSSILSGTAANAAKFGGYTVSSFLTMVGTLTVDNANRIGGMSVNEFVTFVGENAAVQNASTVEGFSAQDLMNYTDEQITTKIAAHDLTLQDQFTTVTSELGSHTVSINALGNALTAVTSRVNATEAAITALQGTSAQQATTISGIQTQVSANTNDIAVLLEDTSTIAASLAALTANVEQMNTDIIAAFDSLSAQINTIVTNQS